MLTAENVVKEGLLSGSVSTCVTASHGSSKAGKDGGLSAAGLWETLTRDVCSVSMERDWSIHPDRSVCLSVKQKELPSFLSSHLMWLPLASNPAARRSDISSCEAVASCFNKPCLPYPILQLLWLNNDTELHRTGCSTIKTQENALGDTQN